MYVPVYVCIYSIFIYVCMFRGRGRERGGERQTDRQAGRQTELQATTNGMARYSAPQHASAARCAAALTAHPAQRWSTVIQSYVKEVRMPLAISSFKTTAFHDFLVPLTACSTVVLLQHFL